MQFHFVETRDPLTRERRGHVLDSTRHSDEANDLLEAFRSARLSFHYLLAEITCDDLEDLYDDFRYGITVSSCSLSILNRVKSLLIQEGFCIVENMKDVSEKMVNYIYAKNDLPDLRQRMFDATDSRAVIEFTREELKDFLHYCLRAGMQEYLRQETTNDSNQD